MDSNFTREVFFIGDLTGCLETRGPCLLLNSERISTTVQFNFIPKINFSGFKSLHKVERNRWIGRKGVSPRKYTKQLYSPYELGLFSTLMARKVRIEYAGAYYHVINLGNYRSWIFESVGAPGKWLWLGICAKTAWLQTDGWRSG